MINWCRPFGIILYLVLMDNDGNCCTCSTFHLCWSFSNVLPHILSLVFLMYVIDNSNLNRLCIWSLVQSHIYRYIFSSYVIDSLFVFTSMYWHQSKSPTTNVTCALSDIDPSLLNNILARISSASFPDCLSLWIIFLVHSLSLVLLY